MTRRFAEIDLAGGRLGRQFKTANERGCRFVAVEGPDERAAVSVTIKDMAGGTRAAVSRRAPA